jgi:hypothetical protein
MRRRAGGEQEKEKEEDESWRRAGEGEGGGRGELAASVPLMLPAVRTGVPALAVLCWAGPSRLNPSQCQRCPLPALLHQGQGRPRQAQTRPAALDAAALDQMTPPHQAALTMTAGRPATAQPPLQQKLRCGRRRRCHRHPGQRVPLQARRRGHPPQWLSHLPEHVPLQRVHPAIQHAAHAQGVRRLCPPATWPGEHRRHSDHHYYDQCCADAVAAPQAAAVPPQTAAAAQHAAQDHPTDLQPAALCCALLPRRPDHLPWCRHPLPLPLRHRQPLMSACLPAAQCLSA